MPVAHVRLQPVPHQSLAQLVAGRLASLILEGKLATGEQLPSERDLVEQLEVSRSTLRESLRILADNRLIQVRPGVGTYVRVIDRSNYAEASQLAQRYRQAAGPTAEPAQAPEAAAQPEPPPGPKPLRIHVDKPLHIPNLRRDRLGTFDLISWWERDRVQSARVMVVGAGALGNEVIKNLSLMGIGHLFIVDFDHIEAANLARSVLFRDQDTGRPKAETAAARAKALNPDIRVQYFHGDVTHELGLGVFRRMDVLVGCLDNREARLALNRFAYWTGRPWVDGAIQELLGLVRVFLPGQGACYECTLTEQARRELSLRYSCPLLARSNLLLGKVPTTPTIASIIGGIQSQETLKLLHGMPVESGKVTHFNGMTNEVHTSAYLPDPDCESHWSFGEITELPRRAQDTTLREVLEIARGDLGPEAVIELDQELVLSLECPTCKTNDEVMRPISRVSYEDGLCPTCGQMRTVHMTHVITGEESFLSRTLASIGVPPLHILRSHNGREYRFYELTGDLDEALHFRHYQTTGAARAPEPARRVRLGPPAPLASERPAGQPSRRIVLRDER
jgi:adenylyltransferase/sulfurtransferase